MVAFGCVWLRLVAFGCVWLRLVAFGCIWLHLGAILSLCHFKQMEFVMLKFLCFLSVFSIFIPKSAAAFGGDNLSFEELVRVCIDDVEPNSMSFCNSYGFNYETLETSLLTDEGDVISFKTQVVLSGAKVLVQSNSGFTILCHSCLSDSIDNQAVLVKFKSSFELASINSAFNTQRTKRNNKKTPDVTSKNNGSSFSEDFKNFGSGLKDFSAAFDSLFSNYDSSKDDSSMILIENAEGKPHALVRIDAGKYVLVVDFTKATRSSDGSVSFSGSLSPGSYNDYTKSVGIIFGGMTCRTTYTGSDENMVAQTTCW